MSDSTRTPLPKEDLWSNDGDGDVEDHHNSQNAVGTQTGSGGSSGGTTTSMAVPEKKESSS